MALKWHKLRANGPPPTGDQLGLLGTHWSKGWVIEHNNIHDARSAGISIGKERSTGECAHTDNKRLPGYQNQINTVFQAWNTGWSSELVGSHAIRNNIIHDCGQNAIVGNLGCIFSTIVDNDIYDIGTKYEFFGHEIAGIKLHAAIDVYIIHNHIHNCTLGTWLDWEAQGTRVSSNVYDNNRRDFMIEVTSGPCLVDNNIFASEYNVDNAAQGTAFVHNLFAGTIQRRCVLNRATPYHYPHSTSIAGISLVYGSDDRVYQNIFIGGREQRKGITRRGTDSYDGSPASEREYITRVIQQGVGDVEIYEKVDQPAYINANTYLFGAPAFSGEKTNIISPHTPDMTVFTDENDHVCVKLTIRLELLTMPTCIIDTKTLGTPRIVGQPYEHREGKPLIINQDIVGNTRKTHPVPGPSEFSKSGEHIIRVF